MRRWLVSIGAALAGCGGGNRMSFDAASPDASADAAPSDGRVLDSALDAGAIGADHTYVVDRLLLPEIFGQQNTYGLDLDGDGAIDNALGVTIAAVRSAGGSAVFEFQAMEDDAVASRSVIDLIDVKATDLTTSTNAGLIEYEGAVAGSGVEVASGSPTDAAMIGAISAGAFTGGPGRALLVVVLFDSQPIAIRLRGARAVIGAASTAGLSQGVLGGGITEDDMNGQVLPAIAAGMTARIAHDCTLAGPLCGCPSGTRGLGYASVFDKSPADCRVTVPELQTNDSIKTLIVPDVLLGIPPKPCLSFGVGFTAVPASYAVP